LAKGKINLTHDRQKDIVYMILAITLIFILVPISIHLVTGWNNIVTPGEYTRYEEDDFKDISLFEMGQNQGFYEQENIIWNETSYSILAVETNSSIIPDPSFGVLRTVLFTLDIDAEKLLNDNINKFKINLNYSKNFQLLVGLMPYHGTDQYYEYKEEYSPGEYEIYVNISTLDILTLKAEHGDLYLYFQISGLSEIEAGDLIYFDFQYYKPGKTELNPLHVYEYGGAILGIFLIAVAVMSTPYWNPTDPKHPGPIDKGIGWIRKKIKRRKDKK